MVLVKILENTLSVYVEFEMSQPNAILFAELPTFAADVMRGHLLHRMVVYPLVNI